MYINLSFEVMMKNYIRDRKLAVDQGKVPYVDSKLKMAESRLERAFLEAFKVIEDLNHELDLDLSDMDKKDIWRKVLSEAART